MALLYKNKTQTTEEIRRRLREIEKPIILVFSYDESLRKFDGDDFRKALIEKFLRFERGCGLVCPVSTTIYIKTYKDKPLEVWSQMIKDNFKGLEFFYFTIAQVTFEDLDFMVNNDSINQELKENFDELVKEIAIKLYPK